MKFDVIHVLNNGDKHIIRKAVSLVEANEAFYGIDNTYIIETGTENMESKPSKAVIPCK